MDYVLRTICMESNPVVVQHNNVGQYLELIDQSWRYEWRNTSARVSAQGARETVHISHYVVTFEGPGIAITYSR